MVIYTDSPCACWTLAKILIITLPINNAYIETQLLCPLLLQEMDWFKLFPAAKK
jgi:hypothetical protein